MRKLSLFLSLFLFSVSVSVSLYGQDPEQQLKQLNITLPPATNPAFNYVKFVRTGNLLFLAGHGPRNEKGENITGKLGDNLTTEQGYAAANACTIDLIATLKSAVGGDLKKVKRIVKVFGLVNCTANYYDQPKVMNGCSDLLVAVFGEKGKHARTSVGANALPNNIAVEIELVAEVE
ncbi:RidA family protein [Pollutibacter soli]|uniref:RidA family protein n=1 Tax=Pollutibacter soli TaxID=3034157 RepID=UPI003013E8C8